MLRLSTTRPSWSAVSWFTRAVLVAVVACAGIKPIAVKAADSELADSVPMSVTSSVDFSRDVRPILSDHCYACHGPDEAERQADLRLDTADGIASMIEPGDLTSSELADRIATTDPDRIMPPPRFHKPLSPQQQATLREWIASGATFEQHWSFSPPVQRKPPSLANSLSPIKNVPAVQSVASTPIDSFLLARIQQAGLTPNSMADRRTLLRRVCLDLLGLPPTREQVNEFLSDQSPDAYERLVDRLMQSPRFGEHMGRHWLDLVRYGDTHGLHLDNYREMWPYREWVINAFNQNMPFDQFITEQLAGDLLPGATDQQLIASGFNRLNVTTNEGGSIYDEVFARNVIDRTDAFGIVFLGLTTGCAVCHDHKFDPLTQRDFYALSAYFNSLDGRAMDENIKDPAPVLRVPSDQQKELLKQYDDALAELQQEMTQPIPSVDQAQRAWEASLISGQPPATAVLKPLMATSEVGKEMMTHDDGSVELVGPAADKDTTTIVASLPTGSSWQTLQLEALTETPQDRVGASSNGNVVLSEIVIETSDDQQNWIPVPIKHALADFEQADGPFEVRFAIDEKINDGEGWAVGGHQQTGPRTAWFVVPALMSEAQDPQTQIRIQLKYQSKFAAHQFKRIRLSLSDAAPSVPESQQITFGPIHSIGPFPVESASPGYGRTFASRGSDFDADAVFNYNDKPYRWRHRDDIVPVEVNELETIPDRASVMLLHQSIQTPRAQKATLLIGADDGHVVFLNGKRVALERGPSSIKPLHFEYDVDLVKGANRLYVKVVNHGGPSQLAFAWRSPAIAPPAHLVQSLQTPADQRSKADRDALRKYYRSAYCLHPDWLARLDHAKGIQVSRDKVIAQSPTTLVWKELQKPRQARILVRGQYDQPGDPVSRGTPGFLSPLPEQAPNDRLGLARWLCDSQNPLTARVAVNRFWQQLFGTGLVKTSEDFGNQGAPPSHPELLDYLAVDFRENGWDVRRLIKTIVMSDAYRRSADVTAEMLRIDPNNRLLARGPRYRLDAEVLRDQALALSGLLKNQIGGPSVKPPQPDGLWHAVGFTRSNTAKFTADTEDQKIYRRSVYIFWKRTSAPPQMSTFDAPSRESCTARRERTNTPLQALVLMNETQYVHAAKHLAQRALDQPERMSVAEKVAWLFESVTIRPPGPEEQSELVQLIGDLTRFYAADTEAAVKLVGQEKSGSQQNSLAKQKSHGQDATDAVAQKAAWTILASTLLNLDEVVSK
ncbi:MAG: DUF1553 domain-containing protein [Pirellulaceae bacterium]|nr:DUF1553 domain-containing protein [Pirellulaceae bacterium]